MPVWGKVVIDGVGLLGGSIGLTLRRRGLADEVVGLGRSAERLAQAVHRGAIDRWDCNPATAAADADIAVVCTPVHLIVGRALALAPHLPLGASLTDAGSTKEEICRRLAAHPEAASRFVGAHPLAGGHHSGVEHARSDLFQDRVTILTPWETTSVELLDRVTAFWRSLGCTIRRLSPGEHDQVLAYTSHVPHLVAAALAASTPADALPLTASGWADTTRIASSDPELWLRIFQANRVHSLRALENFAKVLASIQTALDGNDTEALRQWLEIGKRNRDAVAS